MVGLSKRARTDRLLKVIGGKTVTNPAARNNVTKPATTKKRSRTPEKEIPVDAPPVNSSDEGPSEEDEPEAETGANKRAKTLPSCDDERGSPDRGHIIPASFKTSEKTTTRAPSKAKYGAKSNGRARGSQEPKPSSSQTIQDERDALDELGPVKGLNLLKNPDKRIRGGPTARPPRIREPRPPKRAKKAPEKPAQPSTPPKPKIIMPKGDSQSAAKGAPPELQLSAPSPNAPSSERSMRLRNDYPKSPTAPAAEANLDLRHLVDRSAQSRGNIDDPKKGPKLLEPKSTPTATQDLSQDLSFNVDDSPLLDLSFVDDSEDEKKTETICPLCKKPVDPDTLQNFSKGAFMTIRKQRRFCAMHKQDEARAEWKAKGYPEMDWAGLEARIAPHEAYLKGVLLGQQCHYRDLMARDAEGGNNRNLADADFDKIPGYYGTKGFRIMQEGMFKRFTKLLKKRSTVDKLISGRGYSMYVQAVMVPELAVKLVMEDMGVGEEGARRILEESAWVGDMLCEDEGDVVDVVEDDDGGDVVEDDGDWF